MSNPRFTTSNRIPMISCEPLSWQVQKTYHGDHIKPNPEFYSIGIGDMAEMWLATFLPETMELNFSNYSEDSHDIVRFKMDSLEQASDMVLRFAKGMGMEDNLKETIYTLKP